MPKISEKKLTDSEKLKRLRKAVRAFERLLEKGPNRANVDDLWRAEDAMFDEAKRR